MSELSDRIKDDLYEQVETALEHFTAKEIRDITNNAIQNRNREYRKCKRAGLL